MTVYAVLYVSLQGINAALKLDQPWW